MFHSHPQTELLAEVVMVMNVLVAVVLPEERVDEGGHKKKKVHPDEKTHDS